MKVEWLVLRGLGVLVSDWRRDGQTDISDCKVAIATYVMFKIRILKKLLFSII